MVFLVEEVDVPAVPGEVPFELLVVIVERATLRSDSVARLSPSPGSGRDRRVMALWGSMLANLVGV